MLTLLSLSSTLLLLHFTFKIYLKVFDTVPAASYSTIHNHYHTTIYESSLKYLIEKFKIL